MKQTDPSHEREEEGWGRSAALPSSSSPKTLWLLGTGLFSDVPEVDDDEIAGGPWLALPQLVVKGLFQPETEALALQAMASVARQIARAGRLGLLTRLHPLRDSKQALRDSNIDAIISSSIMPRFISVSSSGLALSAADGGVEAVIGSAEVGLVISLSAALPWLCVHVGAGELADTVAAFLRDCSAAAGAIGLTKLSGMLGVLAVGPPPAPPGVGFSAWLPDLAEVLACSFFPTYSRLVIQRLMETVQRAPERYQAAALCALRAIFEVPGLDLGSPAWFVDDSHLVDLLSSEVGGPLGPRVLDLLQTMAAFRGKIRVEGF